MVTRAPEKVTHTRALEPKPWRVTIKVARSPSGVVAGSVALNVSSGVLTTHHQETVGGGARMMQAPAGPLFRPELQCGQLTSTGGFRSTTPDRASAFVHPTRYGTGGSDCRLWLGGVLEAGGCSWVGCSGGFGAGCAQLVARGFCGSWLGPLCAQGLVSGYRCAGARIILSPAVGTRILVYGTLECRSERFT